MKSEEKKQLLIGIAGGSGCGKTTLIHQLLDHFDSDQISLISQDDYYKPRELQTRDKEGIKNFDLPSAIYLDRLYYDILKLQNGEDVTLQEYTFNNEKKKASTKTIRSAPVIIVEGLYVFHYKLIKDLFDLKLFVHAHDVHKIIRRISRDIEERNYPMDDVIYRYQNHVQPSYKEHIEPHMWDTDIIINNNTNFDAGLEVIKGFISNYLNKLTR